MVTLYLLDAHKRVRAVLHDGVEELVHNEVAGTVNATFPGNTRPEPGELLGFLCIDGRFRLFCIDDVDFEDETGQAIVTGTDEAVREMMETVIPDEVQVLDADAYTALSTWLASTPWQLGSVSTGGKVANLRSYYQSLWDIMGSIATAYALDIVPYYTFSDNQIAGRYVDVRPDEGEYKGRFVESGYDADKVTVSNTGVAVTALYGLGAPIGVEENSPHLTFADVEWSTAAGNPADKPAGQDWIGDESARVLYGRDGRHRFATALFDDIEDAEELLAATWEHLQTVNRPKLSASGSLYDLELIEGAEHAAIRRGDIIRLRALHYPEDVEARVIEIKRNYVDAARTIFEIGDKTASATTVAREMNINAQHTQKTVTIHKNMIRANKELIDLTADLVSIHGERLIELTVGQEELSAQILLLEDRISLSVTKDELQAAIDILEGMIALKADSSDLDDLRKKFSNAEIIIDGLNAKILLKADQTVVDELGERVSKAEILIDGANAKIELKASREEVSTAVDALDKRISQAEIDIDGANARIDLKADLTEIEGMEQRLSAAEVAIDGANARIDLKANASTVNSLSNRVTSAELTIDGMEGEISTKVSKNGVISAINQTSESVTISASRINLSGYVTATEFSALETTTNSLKATQTAWATTFNTNTLGATTAWITGLHADSAALTEANITNIVIKGDAANWKEDISVCTRSATYYSNTVDIVYIDGNTNTKKSLTVVTGITQAQSPAYRTINYLGKTALNG